MTTSAANFLRLRRGLSGGRTPSSWSCYIEPAPDGALHTDDAVQRGEDGPLVGVYCFFTHSETPFPFSRASIAFSASASFPHWVGFNHSCRSTLNMRFANPLT